MPFDDFDKGPRFYCRETRTAHGVKVYMPHTEAHKEHLRHEQDHLRWTAEHMRALAILKRVEAHLFQHEAEIAGPIWHQQTVRHDNCVVGGSR